MKELSIEEKAKLKNILFQNKAITYDEYNNERNPFVVIFFDNLIKILETL